MESLNWLIGSIPVTELSPLYWNKLLICSFIICLLLVLAGSKRVLE